MRKIALNFRILNLTHPVTMFDVEENAISD